MRTGPVALGYLGDGQEQALADAADGRGNDTDTVAAIAGSLAGGKWGGSAVPES